MKKFFLMLIILSFQVSANAQTPRFYILSNQKFYDIESIAIRDITNEAVIKVKIDNPMNYRFFIKSVSIHYYLEQHEKGGSGAQGGSGAIKQPPISLVNTQHVYSKSPEFDFNLQKLPKQIGPSMRIAFTIDDIEAESSSGQKWIDNYSYNKEVKLTWSIVTNDVMSGKGQK